MSIKISGILPGPTGEPAAHIGITLRAVKTSLTVVVTLESTAMTGVDGSYSLNVEPGQYDVLLWVDGINARNVGRITVYSDSLPGTLNNFLTALREEDGTPEIIRQLEQLRAEALQAALEAKQSKDEATTQAEIATAAAGNAAQETTDLITATVRGDADRAEAAREGAETAQSAVNALTDEVVHYHTDVGQLALASEGSAAAAAQSSNSAAQSASESESSKNAAAQSKQEALASAESAGNSATAAAGDKSAANSFRNEAEQFAVQAKASAESIDMSVLEAQINEKVSQTVFDEAIAGKASNEALTEGLADKMDIAGGEFTGPVKLHGNATNPLEAVTKQQLDAVTSLESRQKFAFHYMDGTEVTWANIGANVRKNYANPFPGRRFNVVAQLYAGPGWGETGWIIGQTSGLAFGVKASVLNTTVSGEFGSIIVQTGDGGLAVSASKSGSSFGETGNILTGYVRLFCWTID